MNQLIVTPASALLPAQLFAPTPEAAKRVLEFFTAQINNDHTRKAYLAATRHFADWCDLHGIQQLEDVQPFHVAAFVKDMEGHVATPTVKQHLAAIRRLFDWLVTGCIIDVNPAHAVRGPKYVVKKGKTPVLTPVEARELLDSIEVVKKTKNKEGAETEDPDLTGLRDRALIGVMVYTFARVNAVINMKVKDYFTQGKRGWVRLHEKGGKEHEVPCHHTLEQYLDEYIQAAGNRRRRGRPTLPNDRPQDRRGRGNGQQDAYRMIQRRSAVAGIETKSAIIPSGPTGITAYLKNKGLLEHAQTLANHSSPRTTKLYDRRTNEISLDEVEKIAV